MRPAARALGNRPDHARGFPHGLINDRALGGGFRHARRSLARLARDAAVECRPVDRRAHVYLEELVRDARAGFVGRRLGDRRRRMAGRAGRDGPLRRRADVAGHAQHPRPGVLQPRDQPLRAVHGRADFHGQVSHLARATVLAVHVPAARLWRRVSLPGRQRGHAAGGGLFGAHSLGARRGIAGARAGHWRLSGGDAALDLRRQDLQHAQAGHVVQDRDRVGLLAVRGDFLFQRRHLARDSDRLRPIRHRAGATRRRRQRQRRSSIPAKIGTATVTWTSSSRRFKPTIDSDGDGKPETWADVNGDGKPDKFEDIDGDGVRDGDATENVFLSLASGRGMPTIDFSTIALLAAFAAIAGCGGLSNAPISNYTRD